jgi:hypothetical protein
MEGSLARPSRAIALDRASRGAHRGATGVTGAKWLRQRGEKWENGGFGGLWRKSGIILVVGLEHEFYDFPFFGKNNNNTNGLSYFSEGLKPPSIWDVRRLF